MGIGNVLTVDGQRKLVCHTEMIFTKIFYSKQEMEKPKKKKKKVQAPVERNQLLFNKFI